MIMANKLRMQYISVVARLDMQNGEAHAVTLAREDSVTSNILGAKDIVTFRKSIGAAPARRPYGPIDLL